MEPTITPPPETVPHRTPRAALLFCAALVLVGVVYLGIAAKRFLFPPVNAVPMATYDIGEAAREYLRQTKPQPLSDKLAEVVAEGKRLDFETQPHPLLGKAAPDFTRIDVEGKPRSLKESLAKGPVVVVFYFGYYCGHCVSQLFDLNENLARFRELGVEVVALSPDSPEVTRERYQQNGKFDFPVLHDRGNRVADAYGVFSPARDGKPESLLHGTFVLDEKGIVRWARTGETPFGYSETLIYELAKIKGIAK